MIIRFLNSDDVEAYRALRLSSLKESPFAFSDSYEDLAPQKARHFEMEIETSGMPLESFALGAFADTNELVGFVRFKRDQRTKARHRASLHSLYVATQFRGKGLAKKLILKLVKFIEPLPGLEQLQLWAIISNTSLIPFYEKFGFQKSGGLIEKDLIINGQYVDAFYMVKYLKQ
jgi:ribosomal protein S18 acetylase RimI-like enzyme